MKRARKNNLNYYLSCAQKVFKAKPQGMFVNLGVLPFQRGKQAFYEVSVIFMLLKRSKKRNLTKLESKRTHLKTALANIGWYIQKNFCGVSNHFVHNPRKGYEQGHKY